MNENRNLSLSERELELLRRVATGASNQQIAKELVISVNTVKVHLRNIFEKLGVESRTEATLVAIRQGWVPVDGMAETQAGPVRQESREEIPPRQPISLFQRIFLVVAALGIFVVAFLPPVGSQTVSGENNSPFTERPPGSSPLASAAAEEAARWTTLPSLLTPRGRLAGVYQDGRIYAIGGDTDGGVTGAVEVFDKETNRWTPLPDKPTPASNISAAFAAGRIWVPGGFLPDGSISDILEVYDPETNAWESGPALPRPLCGYALVSLDDVLYLFGGADHSGYLDVAYRLDVAVGEWRELPRLASPRAFAAATVSENRIYLIGGYDGRRELDICEVYSPLGEVQGESPWSSCAPLNVPRGGLGLAAVSSTLYAIGGGWESYLTNSERYDLASDKWTTISTPVTGEWRNLAVASDGQRVYAIGGWDGRYLDTVRAYQAIVNIFLPITP